MNTLCLGETIVDLVCERPVDHFGQADSFVPHCGGAAAIADPAARDFDLSAAADAPPAAVEATAHSTEGRGAVDALPVPMPQ